MLRSLETARIRSSVTGNRYLLDNRSLFSSHQLFTVGSIHPRAKAPGFSLPLHPFIITARDYQLHTASIMNKIYPEQLCVASNGWAECKTIGCVNVPKCEAAALKRLRIEGRIIRALDELPEEPICNCKEHRTGCMNQEEARDFNSKKIDPRKTWIY